jgi:hypothetical protein
MYYIGRKPTTEECFMELIVKLIGAICLAAGAYLVRGSVELPDVLFALSTLCWYAAYYLKSRK